MASATSKHVRWSTWTMRILMCWITLLLAAASGEELASTTAVSHWETMLHGGGMPSTIQAMLSPLTSHQATQLLLHINAYLPTHAASFCEAAHIQCGPNTLKLPASDDPDDTNPDDANLFGYHYRKAAPAKAEPVHARPASDNPDDANPDDANLFGYHYRKAATVNAEPVQARPASNDPDDANPDDANLFGYHYRKAATAKAEPVHIARPSSDDPDDTNPDDANLFGYHYRKAVTAKAEPVQARPVSDDPDDANPDDANLFGYHYRKAATGKAEPVHIARPASDNPDDANPDDANLFGYHYRKAATAKAEPVQARPASDDPDDVKPDDANLFGYHYRKAATGKGEPVQARPASDDPDDANPDDANLFGYHYRKAAPIKTLPASDIAPSPAQPYGWFDYGYKSAKLLASAIAPSPAEPRSWFDYGYNKAGKDGKASLALQSRTSEESGRASRALMSSTIHEIPGVFFRQEQVLVTGARIHVNLATYSSLGKDGRAFLPQKLAQVFPLSDEGAKGISRMLGFGREALQDTIDHCNPRNRVSTEVDACLASVEDIVDFVSSTMGSSRPINAYDSILNASNMNFSGKTFLVDSVQPLKKDIAEPAITCHDMSFPFRVFFCHYAKRTMVFRVKLKGEDGTSHERLSVCHYDTSSWDPEHLSFAELHTKPGQAEACHWLGKSWTGQSGWVFSFA